MQAPYANTRIYIPRGSGRAVEKVAAHPELHAMCKLTVLSEVLSPLWAGLDTSVAISVQLQLTYGEELTVEKLFFLTVISIC